MRRSTKFGNELRRLRIACGLTQQAVADALHVNRATYTYYETGTTTPSVERLGKIAEILGVSELHLAGLLQAPFETEPLDTRRAPKKVAGSPEHVGQLTPQEKSLREGRDHSAARNIPGAAMSIFCAAFQLLAFQGIFAIHCGDNDIVHFYQQRII